MVIFKRKYVVRSYKEPEYENGYLSLDYSDRTVVADIQTTDRSSKTTDDGSDSLQRIKMFCDEQLIVDDRDSKSRSDRVWFQNKWFECRSCRLSNNTYIAHYVATFVECIKQDEAPTGD